MSRNESIIVIITSVVHEMQALTSQYITILTRLFAIVTNNGQYLSDENFEVFYVSLICSVCYS